MSRLLPKHSVLHARTFIYLIMLDCLAIGAGFVIAALIRDPLLVDTSWIIFIILVLPIFLMSAVNAHAYSASQLRDGLHAVFTALRSFLLAFALATMVVFYLKIGSTFSRLTVALGSVIGIALLVVGRLMFVRNMQRIIGGNPFSTALIWEADQPMPNTHFSIVIAASSLIDPESHDPVAYDRLAKTLEGVHNVVVSCAPERRVAWTHALTGANVQGEILVPELSQLAPMGTGRHGEISSLVVTRGPLSLVDRAVKRGFDLVLVSIAILPLLPVMLAVAGAIKLTSPGPVFFRQKRIGRGNQVFEVFKFRSMRVETTDGTGHRSAARNDDRITPVGRLIRKTSLDELPQLFNIIRGDMSIVGPRPHALGSRAADKLFWDVDGRYWHRHAAKPGLTGLAQVRGFRGATLEEDDLVNRLHADLEYLSSWSIWGDFKIIIMTFGVLLHRNAF